MKLGGEPDSYHCKVPEGSTVNESIPWVKGEDGMMQLSKCSMFKEGMPEDEVSCTDGWQYEGTMGPTFVTEVGLYF